MIVNLFQNKEVAHDTNKVYKTMKSNYSVNVNFSGVFENVGSTQELRTIATDITEQLCSQLFAHVGTMTELKELAQSIVNNVNASFKVRKSEIAPSTEGTQKAVAVEIASTPTAKAITEPAPAKVATQTTKSTAKASKSTKSESKKEEVQQVLIASLTKEDIKKMGIKFYQYSERCVSMVGETKPIKDDIKHLAGGHWNGARQCWFLKDKNGKALAKAMGLKVYKKAE